MVCKVEYMTSKGIIKDWLWVKYQVLNNCFDGISLNTNGGKPELIYAHDYQGAALFFDDDKCEKMKTAGYFIGQPGRYMGEGSIEISDKAVEELVLEQKRFEEEKQKLLEKGYKLFMEPEILEKEIRGAFEYYSINDFRTGMEWEMAVYKRKSYLSKVYGLYLVPEKGIGNIEIGTVLVSSIDAEEIIYNGELDWEMQDGFSKYGIRLMPVFADEALQ